MKQRIYAILLGSMLAISLAQAQGQSPKAPDTYSFTATASTVSSPLTVKVYRNGSRELMETFTAGAPEKYHVRVWYDFNEHRLYTLDANSKICTTQAYESAWAPTLFDPIGGVTETFGGQSGPPPQAFKKDVVNGIAAKTMETTEDGSKIKVWLDEKLNFMVKLGIGEGGQPMTTRFEMKQLSYAPSPESLFVHPRECQQVGGASTATGGHAESTVDVHAQSEAQLGPAQPGTPPATPGRESSGPAKVTAVQLRLAPQTYNGPCPTAVQLVGEITTDGPGQAYYQFQAGAVGGNRG